MIKIRPYKDSDFNFIISTWTKSLYESTPGYRERFPVFHKGIHDAVIKHKGNEELYCYIAYTGDDEDLILGYAVYGSDYTLHYCFTKVAYRKMGVAKSLLDNFFKSKNKIVASHWTRDIKYIQSMYDIEYNRFKFYR